MSNIDFRSYSSAFHYSNNDLMHFGILGMKWGIRRYQNEDGTLTDAGKARKKRELVRDVNNFNRSASNSILKEKSREKLLNNELVAEQAKKLQEVKADRKKAYDDMVKVNMQEYKDFLGACNVIRNQDGIKNFDIKHFNKNVQKYYKIIDDYAKDQGWKDVHEKNQHAGLGNVDDLFDNVKHSSSEWLNQRNKLREAYHNYDQTAFSLAESILKDCKVKKPSVWQQRTMVYALSNVDMNEERKHFA